MGDLDDLPGQLVELRELIRESHAAIKDMDRLVREARGLVRDCEKQAAAAAAAAASEEMKRFQGHIQAEMNRHAKELVDLESTCREAFCQGIIEADLRLVTP